MYGKVSHSMCASIMFYVCNFEITVFHPIQARLLGAPTAERGRLSKRFIPSMNEKLKLLIMINDPFIKHSLREFECSWIEIRLVVHQRILGSMLENFSC